MVTCAGSMLVSSVARRPKRGLYRQEKPKQEQPEQEEVPNSKEWIRPLLSNRFAALMEAWTINEFRVWWSSRPSPVPQSPRERGDADLGERRGPLRLLHQRRESSPVLLEKTRP